MKLLVFGAGVVGRLLYGRLKNYDVSLAPLRESSYHTLETKGFMLAEAGHVQPKLALPGSSGYDLIFNCVKNYQLEASCQLLNKHFGTNKALVIGMQNGLYNQKLLPEYFDYYGFGIVGFNAWQNKDSVILSQSRSPLIFGATDIARFEHLIQCLSPLQESLGHELASDWQSAAYTKLVLNLSNSLSTLVGFGFKPLESISDFQFLLSQLLCEAVGFLEHLGIAEYKSPEWPSWRLLKLSARLPQFLTRATFKRKLKKMVVSSMAQDIIERSLKEHELEYLNGFLLALAAEQNYPLSLNSFIYERCRLAFNDFKATSVSKLREDYEKSLKN